MSERDWSECEKKIRILLVECMGLKLLEQAAVNKMQIDRCHRIGPLRNSGKREPRLMVANVCLKRGDHLETTRQTLGNWVLKL